MRGLFFGADPFLFWSNSSYMAISANVLIKDALSLIDVTAPGEDPEAYWTELAVRILNGMLGEWSLEGLYNPTNGYAQFLNTEYKAYFSLGTDTSFAHLSNVLYSITATVDPAGTHYKVLDGTTTRYSITGSGTKYSLVVTQDSNGTFYQVSGGYSTAPVGDIPTTFANIKTVQVDLAQVVYNPSPITMEEYMALSVKQVQGPPQYWAWDFQQPISKLYFYPRLLPNMTVRVVGQPIIAATSGSTGQINLDPIYYEAILYNLAASLYPFLKRDGGIDQEIIYKAKAGVKAMRSRVIAMTGRHVVVPYGGGAPRYEYWNSPLNTVNTGSN